MRAAVYHGAGDLRIEEVPEPSPSADEALVRVVRSGMCGTDATEWRSGPIAFPVHHRHPASGHLGPLVIGHEFVGEVVQADAAGTLPVGTRVASGAGVWCGACDRCLEGRTNICRRYYTLGLNAPGGMAELVAVPVRALTPLPDDIGWDAAGLAQPTAVGLHAARRAGVRDGDRVLLIGTGAIGSFVLAALPSLARAEITAVDLPGARLERAGRLGASRLLATDLDDERVLEEIGGPADVVIEASGAPGQLDRAIGLTRPGGTVLQVGLPGARQEIDVHRLVMREIGIRTTLAHVCDEDLAPALELLRSGPLAGELLEAVHPLEAAADQLDRLAHGRLDGKVLLDPTSNPTSSPNVTRSTP